MTNQLTVRMDVENGVAVISRPEAVRARTLAVAAAAGSQVLAFTAAANHIPGHEENVVNPIVYPELIYGMTAGLVVGVVVGVVVGAVAGVVVTRKLSSNQRNG